MLWKISLPLLLLVGQPVSPDQDSEVLFRRFLNIRSSGAPAMSPGGSQMAFMTNITGVNQVWRIDGAGAWPHQLTFGENRVMGVTWSPTGDSLIFSRDDGGNERRQIFLLKPDGTGLKDLTGDPEWIHFFGDFSPDGKRISFASNRRNKAYFDIYVMDLPDGEPKLAYQADGYNQAGAWSPDGKRIIVSTWNSNFDAELRVVDLDSGEATRITAEGQMARYVSTNWAQDGKSIYCVSDLGRDFMGIATIDLETRSVVYKDTPDWDVGGIEISRDSKMILSVQNEDGYSRLRVRTLADWKDVSLPALPRGLISSVGFSHNGRFIAMALQGPTATSDVWRIDLDEGKAEKITRSSLAGLDPKKFTEPELIHYPTFDDLEIPAFLYLPRGASRDGTLPFIVLAHGGPESQDRPRFSTFRQFFLQRGYGILAPNVRGSTGYGKEYSHLDDVRNRAHSVEDLVRGVDYLVENKIAHPERIAVMGGSYGGFMCLASITSFPDKFAAGIDIVGIANFKTFLERTGPWRRKLREAEYGSLEEDGEFLEETSPLNHVDKITAPLLVIHGKNDPRVPVDEAEQIVEALRSRDHPVEYLLFDDEGHGVAKLKNRITMYTQIVTFLDRYLLGTSE
ncbi:MAG: S9 family peptidase [Planctomycetota bacterium]|nr:S9 family peptidase [Planctomycetota bacterium]